ncbi:lysostaphin resistance A-like protein [candidate division KSB1 bacterium]
MEELPDFSGENNMVGIEPEETPKGSFRKIFRNRFGHLRAGWRIFLCIIISALVIAVIFFPLTLIYSDQLENVDPQSSLNIIITAFIAFLLIFAVFVILKWIDKRPFGTLGVNFHKGWFEEFFLGLLIGFALLALSFVVMFALGFLDVSINSFSLGLLAGLFKYLLLYLFAGAMEELITRGYMFQALIEGTNKIIATIIFSFIFSILHFFNPSYSIISAVNIFLAGVLLSVVYIKTRSLWMPIGLHMAWNWTQGSLFGVNVSGIEVDQSIFTSLPQGNELFSGGEFGIEGSVISILVLTLFIIWLIRSRRIRPAEENLYLWTKYPEGFGKEPKSLL